MDSNINMLFEPNDCTMGSTDSSFFDHLLQPVDTMSPEGRAELQPLTSPLSGQLESQYPMSSNSAPSYPYNFENIPHMLPHSQTALSSSEPRQKLIDPYEREPYGPTFHGQEPYQWAFQGQQIQGIDQYGNPTYIPAPNGPSIYPAGLQVYPNPPYPTIPPPTPAASNPSGSKKAASNPSGGKKAASNPSGGKKAASNPSGSKKGLKKKQTPRKASESGQCAIDKLEVPKLTAPLSELTNLNHVPLKDVFAWCTRPKEIRLTEKGKWGHVPRPMNSFLLYRFAYSERCKVWCALNLNQVVSTVCGESWALEKPEIKEQFAYLSQIERDNHAKAHPDYKFSPTRTATTRRKRKRTAPEDEDEDEGEQSDLDDTDYSIAVEGKKRAKSA